MDNSCESTDRTATDFFLFGTGFVGFLIGATGVVVGSVGTSLAGGLILLIAVSCFRLRP